MDVYVVAFDQARTVSECATLVGAAEAHINGKWEQFYDFTISTAVVQKETYLLGSPVRQGIWEDTELVEKILIRAESVRFGVEPLTDGVRIATFEDLMQKGIWRVEKSFFKFQ